MLIQAKRTCRSWWTRWSVLLCTAAAFSIAAARGAHAQLKSPLERLNELEKKNEDLQARIEALEKDLSKAEKAAEKSGKGKLTYADGLLTVGGVKFGLGGKVEILMVKTEKESDPIVGDTENPDPHFIIQRFRVEPRLILNRELSVYSRIDFEPTKSDTVLKQLVARFEIEKPAWWLGSESQLGLDYRFIRPSRRTKNYPMVGNAFWRRESIALTEVLRLGDKDGDPAMRSGKKSKGPEGAGTDRFDAQPGYASEGEETEVVREADAVVVVKKERSPFDFMANPGELNLYFSVGHGYNLDNQSVGFDGATFDDIVQDDRNFTSDVSIREIGLGLEYRRSLESLGQIGILGFYYNDELNNTSRDFLQQRLTLRDPVGRPIAGYGDSDSRASERFGFGAEYFLPAKSILGSDPAIRGGDGFMLSGQWIRGIDGRLHRDGWYVQASYRYSFPTRLVADRYFRSVEPIIRYGALNMNLTPVPQLPMLWDRRELMIGGILEVTKEVLIKAEYTFNREDTGERPGFPGPSSVANDELVLELLVEF